MKQTEDQAVAQLAERLHVRFPGVPADTVDQVVATYHHEFDGRPIRTFVPVLVERAAVHRIHALSDQQHAAQGA
ncbi:MAG TPA: hypothetical protein VFD59_13535 [Nocardioidaceae bacterium]|nr:hypothetical protein [Nocardioidaceae bacterium]